MRIPVLITRIVGKTVPKNINVIGKMGSSIGAQLPITTATAVTRTNVNFLNRINNIPVHGVSVEEMPIFEMLKNSMYDLLATTKGKARLPKEIRFERVRGNGLIRKQGVACVTRENVLKINRDYFTHIDENIQTNLQDFIDIGLITRQPNGKYKIADFLRNSKSEIFETRLNEYNKNWPLDYKFKFHRTSMNYYANLTYQARHNPIVMLENIMKTGENQKILKECGLFKTRAEILQMPKEKQLQYLKDIFNKTQAQGKKILLPEDTVLITTPNYVFHHELGHVNHNLMLNNEQHAIFGGSEKLLEWQNNPKIQEVCSRISGYASSAPFEFVADTFSCLANGQKLHPDVMSLYQSLKGPMIF